LDKISIRGGDPHSKYINYSKVSTTPLRLHEFLRTVHTETKQFLSYSDRADFFPMGKAFGL